MVMIDARRKRVLEHWARELGIPLEDMIEIHRIVSRKVKNHAGVQRKPLSAR